MEIGYCRTSTVEQHSGFEAQKRDLKAAGAEKLFCEQVSSVAERKELEHAIEFAREGDKLIVTKLDRLARSVKQLCDISDRLKTKGVALKILNLNIDTSTPTGKLMLHLLGSIAEFEREIMLERQLEGIAAAKEAGKFKGRKPTARAQTDKMVELVQAGKTQGQIAKDLGVCRKSVTRCLAAHEASKASMPVARKRGAPPQASA